MKRTVSILCAISILAALLSGCWNSRELNTIAVVMGIAIDKGEGEDEYVVTTQIARPNAMKSTGDAGSGESTEYINYTRSGKGLQTPLYHISRLTNRELYIGHNQIVIVSSEVAKDGLTAVFDYFTSSADGRYSISFVVSRDKAKDALESDSGLENLPSSNLYSLIQERADMGDISESTLVSFLSDMLGGLTSPTVPIVELEENEQGKKQVVINSIAVFDGSRMCGELSPVQAEVMLVLKNRFRTAFLELERPDGYMILRLDTATTDVTPINKNGRFSIHVDMKQQYTVVDTSSQENFMDEKIRAETERQAKEEVLSLISEAVEYTKEQGFDVFGFGETIRRRFPHKARGVLDNWKEAYKELEVTYNLSVDVQSTGAIMKPLLPDSQRLN